MTSEQSRMHDEYENSNPIIKNAIDAAYSNARRVFTEGGFDLANDDRAEELVVALYKYLIDSAEAK